MGRATFLGLAMLVFATACGAQGLATPSSGAASATIMEVASSAPATLTSSAPVPSQCSNPQATTRAVIDRLFQLSTGGDARAVTDCYAALWRVREPNFEDASARWATAGPVLSLQVDLLDTAGGCDRYRVSANLANGARVGWSGARLQFYAVGPEGATPRIFEVGTALVRADLATTTCR